MKLPIWIPIGMSFAAAVLLIRPRDHYFVPFAFFAYATLAAACGALARLPIRRKPFMSLAGLAAAIALLALLPTYRRGALPSLARARGTPPPVDREGRATVEALRALSLHGERMILAPEFSHAVYARIPFRWIPQGGKDRPFSDSAKAGALRRSTAIREAPRNPGARRSLLHWSAAMAACPFCTASLALMPSKYACAAGESWRPR